MAKILKDYVFVGRGRASGVRWEQWLDGKVYRLQQGVDFFTSVATARAVFAQHCWRNNLSSRTKQDGEGGLIVQAVKKP